MPDENDDPLRFTKAWYHGVRVNIARGMSRQTAIAKQRSDSPRIQEKMRDEARANPDAFKAYASQQGFTAINLAGH